TCDLRLRRPALYPAELRARTVDHTLRFLAARQRQRVARETQIVHHVAVDEVLLDDALGVLGRDLLVPRPFGIDERDRPLVADPQAAHPRAVARTVLAGDVQFLHPLLDVVPRLLAIVLVDAVGTETHEEMPGELADAKRGRRFLRRHAVFLAHAAIIYRGQCG